ncbi:hypothetical protein GGI35DRAFT_441086 [Trichoderma velutinum]
MMGWVPSQWLMLVILLEYQRPQRISSHRASADLVHRPKKLHLIINVESLSRTWPAEMQQRVTRLFTYGEAVVCLMQVSWPV